MSRDMVPINVRDPFWKDPFFSSTWDEFDKMRQDMMTKSKEFWSKVDKDFADFDKQVEKTHREMDMSMAPFQPQLPHWAMPDNARATWTPMKINDEVIKVKDDDSKFEVTLDVSEYKPEELKVTTVNNVLSIEGKHERNRTDESRGSGVDAHGSSFSMRQFSRKWTLPTGCDPNDVISNLSSDGVLMVTAPRKAGTKAISTAEIPIKALKD